MLHVGNQRARRSIWAHEPMLTPEKKLWRAVLEQLYADAELALFLDGTEPIERIVARGLLRADTPQEAETLRLLCECADLPRDRIYVWARQRYPPPPMIEQRIEYCSPTAEN